MQASRMPNAYLRFRYVEHLLAALLLPCWRCCCYGHLSMLETQREALPLGAGSATILAFRYV